MLKAIIKNIYWSLKHKNFKSVGNNLCMSVNSEIIGEKIYQLEIIFRQERI